MTEPQWFYQLGLRLRQQGDEPGARRVWQALVQAFKDVPGEAPWVGLAQERLAESADAQPPERKLEPVREAVRKAKELQAAGQGAEADAILRSLRELYKGDDAALAVIDER
jgi:hypothetical protein